MTIKEVAREAGVSIATVSRVLNGSGRVSAVTRERILAVAARLRYVPHEGARSLITSRTSTLGVLLPDIHGEFFSELLRGIDQAARARGYHLLVSGFHSRHDEVEAMLRAMRGRVDGVLVMSPDLEPLALRKSLPDGGPVVVLNCDPRSCPFDSFAVDSRGGASAMVRHLAGAGRRRIAHLAGPRANVDARERLEGWRESLTALGLPYDDSLLLEGDFTEAAGLAAGRALLARPSRPDAVFAGNDSMAVGILLALREAGVAAPEEVAVAGFDDIPVARYLTPALTSVRVPIAELGEQATERLLSRIEHEDDSVPRHCTLPTMLVVRDSCGGRRTADEPAEISDEHAPPAALGHERSRKGGRSEEDS